MLADHPWKYLQISNSHQTTQGLKPMPSLDQVLKYMAFLWSLFSQVLPSKSSHWGECSKWKYQNIYFFNTVGCPPELHKSSSPGVKTGMVHLIHRETGEKIKKHLWACSCKLTPVRSVGEAAEKLTTSYQLILCKDSSWSSRTRKYHLNKGITSQIKRELKTREDIPLWALHKNAFLFWGAKRLITTTKRAMMKGQGCPLQIPFST